MKVQVQPEFCPNKIPVLEFSCKLILVMLNKVYMFLKLMLVVTSSFEHVDGINEKNLTPVQFT